MEVDTDLAQIVDVRPNRASMTDITEELAGIIGSWSGRGRGIYPTIESFEYLERVTFTRSPKGFVVYQQATHHPDSGAPMHSETGYLRVPAAGGEMVEGEAGVEGAVVEMVVAQPTGIVEVHVGRASLRDGSLTLSFTAETVATTASAKKVVAVTRTITVTGDELRYELHMAAAAQPLQLHLTAALQREFS